MNTVTAALIYALMMVESGGECVVGDNGLAVGVLQIHPCVVSDVNRVYGKKYTLEDRKDKEKSIEICRLYIEHYATEKRIGRPVTDADRARCWNGGPSGWKNPKTIGYWKKVENKLSEK